MKSERLIRLKLERLEESIKMPKANGFQLGVCDGKIQALKWVLGDEDYDSYDYGAQIRDYAVGGIFNSQWFKNYNDNKAVIMPKEEPTEQLNKLKESIKELQRTADELKKKIWEMESEINLAEKELEAEVEVFTNLHNAFINVNNSLIRHGHTDIFKEYLFDDALNALTKAVTVKGNKLREIRAKE